jgi:signal transduction histidine kinase
VNRGIAGVFCAFIFVLLSFQTRAQIIVEGRADLSGFDFGKGESCNLSGSWEFYWNKLLSPDDFRVWQKPEWTRVPGSWNWQGDHDALGFATYRVKLTVPDNENNLSLYFPIVNSAVKIWVNGELKEETGKVSAQRDLYFPKLMGTVVSIPDHARVLEIVVQVANFTYSHGGIAATPRLGRSSEIYASTNRTNGLENFFAGSLVAMFIYQIILFFLYQRGKPHLWLALICLGVALRALIVHGGSFLLPNLFQAVHWEYWKKIEFGAVYAIVALFPLYVRDLFPIHAPKKPIFFFVVVATLLCLTVLLTPQYLYGKLLEVGHIGLLLAFFYAVYSIGHAWRSGNTDARIILLGVIASFPFILAEILKNSMLISLRLEFMYMVELGVLVFLLFQVYLLANHFAKSYKNLEVLNQNLEKIVAERTGELITANTVKDRLLSVMSHDIKSPLNSLRGMLQLYHKGAITKDEFENYIRHIENDLSKTSILVENILYWTSTQLKGVQVRMELFDMYLLMEENIQLFQTIAANKNVRLNHNTPRNLKVRTDKNILNFVLRNLIANAIKFSLEDGVVTIAVSQGNGSLLIQVKDKGVGMDEATLQTLLAPEIMVGGNESGSEMGTGLGLILCREYLQKAGGLLMIESTKGIGSTFNILLAAD